MCFWKLGNYTNWCRTFCPLGHFVPWDVLSLGRFVLWDVWSVLRFLHYICIFSWWLLHFDYKDLTFLLFLLITEGLLRCRVVFVAKLHNFLLPSCASQYRKCFGQVFVRLHRPSYMLLKSIFKIRYSIQNLFKNINFVFSFPAVVARSFYIRYPSTIFFRTISVLIPYTSNIALSDMALDFSEAYRFKGYTDVYRCQHLEITRTSSRNCLGLQAANTSAASTAPNMNYK